MVCNKLVSQRFEKLIVTRISLKPADISFQQPNTNRFFETGSVEAKLLKKKTEKVVNVWISAQNAINSLLFLLLY